MVTMLESDQNSREFFTIYSPVIYPVYWSNKQLKKYKIHKYVDGNINWENGAN